jgi:hypothetical protein
MRMLLIPAFLLAASSAASALPFTGDDRCPNVNQTAVSLQAHEAVAPQDAPKDYLTLAQAYQKCMALYNTNGNMWQVYWAGTHAMQWAYAAGDMLQSSDPRSASQAYQIVHDTWLFLESAGIDNAQYGTQWRTLDQAADAKLTAAKKLLGGK